MRLTGDEMEPSAPPRTASLPSTPAQRASPGEPDMTWTLTEYLTRNHIPLHVATEAALFGPQGFIMTWLADIEEGFLRGVPHLARTQTINDFKTRAKERARTCKQVNSCASGIR